MLSDAEMRRIAERVFKFSDADETEVEIGMISDALTRFANNTIHQNVAEQVLAVSVRTVLDGRTARATTNKLDDESLRRVVETSKSLARSQPRNPDRLPMPGPQKCAKVARYFENTAYATPADRARAVARVAEMAENNKQNRRLPTPRACSRRIARHAPNFRSRFSNPIPQAGPSSIHLMSIESTPRPWLATPAKNQPPRASQARPRRDAGP